MVFIVHSETTVPPLTRAEISNLFLKKRREWNDGTSVRFIDRKEGSRPRALFLKQFLKRSSRDVDLYWIGQKLYSGDSAPIQVDSDSSVMAFVASLKGAMGYINANTVLIEGVKRIEVRNYGSQAVISPPISLEVPLVGVNPK